MEKPKSRTGKTYFHIGENHTYGDFAKAIMEELVSEGSDFPATTLKCVALALEWKTLQDETGITKHHEYCESICKKAHDDYHKRILEETPAKNQSCENGIHIVKCDECDEGLSSAEMPVH